MSPGVLELISKSDQLFWVLSTEVDGESIWAGGATTEEVGGRFSHNLGTSQGRDDISAGLSGGDINGWYSTGGAELLEVGAGETKEDGLLGGGAGFPVNGAGTASTEGSVGGNDGGGEKSEVLEHL